MTYRDEARQTKQEAMTLFKAVPEVSTAFQGVLKAVDVDGDLSAKSKELIAVAISVAVRCEGCILFHIEKAIRRGASRQEVVEALSVAIEMSGGPGTIYAGKALAAFDELNA